MGIFTLVLVSLWLIKSLLLTPLVVQRLSLGQQLSFDLLTLLLLIPALYYLWRLMIMARRKLLWKIRRRLILAHIFIGAIPALLLVLIVSVAIILVYYQFTYYLTSNQIGIHIAQVHAFSQSIKTLVDEDASGGRFSAARMRETLNREGQFVLNMYPAAAIILQFRDPNSRQRITLSNRNVRAENLGQYQVPLWAGDNEFSGLILEDTQPQVYRAYGGGEMPAGSKGLFIRSLIFCEARQDLDISIEISVPLDGDMLERIKAALGQDLLLSGNLPVQGFQVIHQTSDALRNRTVSATSELSEKREIGSSLWSIALLPVSWNSGTELDLPERPVLFVELSVSRLLQRMFRPEGDVSRTILGVLQIVVGFFLAVEFVSLLIGIILTQSITSAVFNLDRGTQFIKRGDFSHRIIVSSGDQLGALAASFNQMTEYIQTLVKERVQKERLERELEIAKEVQEQLFPHSAPRMPRMELSGMCLPARVVSGDYYDFLQVDSNSMALALGDICGKGISAALLMANLQATLRTNVTHFLGFDGNMNETKEWAETVSQVMRRINEQIYRHTSANKFATLFYAVYDDARCRMTYCNAGHNPPLYFSRGGFRRLTAGGTVVGIFPDADYEQETIELLPGDLFLAYTDGIVECVNEYGEEFGEDRLIELVEQNFSRSAEDVQKAVMERVLSWSYEEERDDDMTLIVAKAR